MNVIIEDSCIGCGACASICDAVFSVEDRAVVKEAGVAGNEDCVKEAADACPVGAIEGEGRDKRNINQDKCIKCGNCKSVCKFNAVEVK